jgi:4-amino-4-deoxy-L-arabinose transferase
VDPFIGIVTIAIAAAGYLFAWRFQSKDNYKVAMLFLVIAGAILRIYAATDLCLHTWDERYHALVAKNLIQHPLKPTLYDTPLLPYDFRNWTANHIWLHKQPLPLWAMAASMSLFGVNEIAVRLPSILLSTAGIWLAFYIGTYVVNRRIGFLTAFFFSINGLIIELTGGRVATDHIDIFFLFFVELAVACSILFLQKKRTVYNVLAGISLGAAILSKWLPALIVIPIWLLLVLDSGKLKPRGIIIQCLILCATTVAIFLPWQLYIHRMFPLEAAWEAEFNFRHFTEVIEGRKGPFYYFLDRIRINYGELIYLPLFWYLWKSFENPRDRKRLAVTIWFVIPFLFFSVAETKMQGYLLFASPALFLMTSEFYYQLVEYKKKRRMKWLFTLILLLFIALPARYMVERIKPMGTEERHPQWVANLKALPQEQFERGVLFNYANPVEAMFYTSLVVYPQLPSAEFVSELLENGYTVIVNDDGNIPEEIRRTEGIILREIPSGQPQPSQVGG